MDLDKARDFIRKNHRAVIQTWRADGHPQMSPVLVGIDSEGRALVSTREAAAKTRQLRNNSDVSLCVMVDEYLGEWVQIEGTAEVVAGSDALDPLVEYYRSVSGEHPDWDEYRSAMREQKNVLVRIDLKRAGPDYMG
ncbi:PPOX class F420-dependent enzyme [Sphaerisporangium siamense]|uniref:PPOX class probable F420-dependent enzyme n=1 Tax=Sphaerisporangium siamense TaxID=795645 RepID=A0A7W7D5Q3_9ACTN|nr:PPOX class F420-dependent oxidoreductase [Sphaerisporangium siamense]MBB4700785.1 PPOX class probable F420-dependent enzyme [Sphaerisporangium siamense]GII88838.1 PPOX class F420-dependent enzyme [Sphaerisporangium siamense]